ncbi:hypothetical protein ENUP19_0056G0016 [Entamoeba nuttalli]|uniref:Rap/Ran GTPase activating protein, putative n=2 Tax=Entamoeba nuttalli TaxID=412467 RepID=K2HEC0_ENTNP|nr:Rap/Ran GTPase activating protein, putative [Entamoeba nuttalli P19]EKE41089.1 Rap/Ran GTPase activating protein, putative [Entamoeba nuttalli P19]|eukprot:XP_008856576.1 Rap/Ran GTPase activating protein, putative [Entamoeba nuttalli P19]
MSQVPQKPLIGRRPFTMVESSHANLTEGLESPSGIKTEHTENSNSGNTDTHSNGSSVEISDKLTQRIIQLEEVVHNLTEENTRLQEQIHKIPRTPQQINKEFEYFCTQMPIRGGTFVTGQIDTRTTFIQRKITINFPTEFPEEPAVFVFHLSVTGTSSKVTNIVKDVSGFTVDFGGAIKDVATIFWIAYLPIKVKSKFIELINTLNNSNTMTSKQIENTISTYIKKHGVQDEDKDGNTLLHHLVLLNEPKMVELVLNKGANVNALNKFKYSPLHTALSQNEINIEVVSKLLEHHPDIHIKNETMRTPLHYLCRNTHLEKNISILYRLISNEKDPKTYINEISKIGESSLTCVCSASMNEEAIKYLCENGANVNQVTESGTFPLYYAVKNKRTDIVQILLQYGADIDMTFKGKTIMKIAEETGQMEGVVSLIENKYSLTILSNEEIKQKQDTFDTPKKLIETWTNTTTQSKIILVDQNTLPDYHIENYYTSCTHKYDELMNKNYHDVTLPIGYYQSFIKPFVHCHYCILKTDINTGTKENTIITIKQDSNDKKFIVWTKRSTIRKTAPIGVNDIQILKEFGYKGSKAIPITIPDINNKIEKFENYFIIKDYKFGVLYATEGQTLESELFNNKIGSKHFEKFLELLGKKIKLQGYNGFAGGLDTKYQLTGEYSYVNSFSNDKVSIMYHIAPYLPWSDNNPQQLDKKKHIGNDIVVLIFKEYRGKPELIDISSFKTQFNHAFIVVGYDLNQPENEIPKYSVNVMCKHDISPIPPFITTDQYTHSQLFSNFLISKLINAEVASRESSQFRTKNVMIRGKLLNEMMEGN